MFDFSNVKNEKDFREFYFALLEMGFEEECCILSDMYPEYKLWD